MHLLRVVMAARAHKNSLILFIPFVAFGQDSHAQLKLCKADVQSQGCNTNMSEALHVLGGMCKLVMTRCSPTTSSILRSQVLISMRIKS